jgi:hypothetical protein
MDGHDVITVPLAQLLTSWSSFVMHFLLLKTALVKFEVFTLVTMKNGVFWNVTPGGSCKNLRFGGT